MLPLQTPLWQSLPLRQLSPFGQSEQEPPQSSSVSLPFCTPSLQVGRKFLCRVKDPETIVLMCPLEEKEMLLGAAPDVYFETDHYRGWPAILVRYRHSASDRIALLLSRAWWDRATKA